MLSKEYRQGYKAFYDGVSLMENPYAGQDTTAEHDWDAGWEWAQRGELL